MTDRNPSSEIRETVRMLRDYARRHRRIVEKDYTTKRLFEAVIASLEGLAGEEEQEAANE